MSITGIDLNAAHATAQKLIADRLGASKAKLDAALDAINAAADARDKTTELFLADALAELGNAPAPAAPAAAQPVADAPPSGATTSILPNTL